MTIFKLIGEFFATLASILGLSTKGVNHIHKRVDFYILEDLQDLEAQCDAAGVDFDMLGTDWDGED